MKCLARHFDWIKNWLIVFDFWCLTTLQKKSDMLKCQAVSLWYKWVLVKLSIYAEKRRSMNNNTMPPNLCSIVYYGYLQIYLFIFSLFCPLLSFLLSFRFSLSPFHFLFSFLAHLYWLGRGASPQDKPCPLTKADLPKREINKIRRVNNNKKRPRQCSKSNKDAFNRNSKLTFA